MLKLMYITNQPEVAQIAEHAGVDRIWVDMEYIGKVERQGGMDTVQSHHTLEDVAKIARTIHKSELLVRINPIHDATGERMGSKREIDGAIEAGADILMLPYFRTCEEVRQFAELAAGRIRSMILVETTEAVAQIDRILEVGGIDEYFIGLNDLSLGYGKKFMFELLSDGTVEDLCNKFRKKGKPYGFGGIAAIGKGMLPAEYIIPEHYRLGSAAVILSRSFCNTGVITDLEEIRSIFETGVKKIRECEQQAAGNSSFLEENSKLVEDKIKDIVNG